MESLRKEMSIYDNEYLTAQVIDKLVKFKRCENYTHKNDIQGISNPLKVYQWLCIFIMSLIHR